MMRGFWSTLHNSAFYTPHQVHNMRPPMTILHYAMPCYAMPSELYTDVTDQRLST